MGIRQFMFMSVCLVGAYVSSGAEPVTTEQILQRGLIAKDSTGRLAAVLEKARRGEAVTIAAIGGSITAGGLQTKNPENRYVARIAAWFTKTFPKAKVQFVNAGIGGTNSVYGAMRIKDDVLSKKPDLVVVEYAVNNKPYADFAESYEGVLRQILREPQKPAVIELFFMHRKGENEQESQVKLGNYYGLPMVSFRDAWWPELSAGKAVWEDMYADVVHPNDTGHILASALLIALLEQANQQALSGAPLPPVKAELPPPMLSDIYTDCVYSKCENMKPLENKGWSKSPDGRFWETKEPGSVIELEFSGRILFLGFDMDKGLESRVKFSIDGGEQQILKVGGDRPPIAKGLSPGKHRIRIELTGKPEGEGANGKIRIWGIGGAGAGS